MPRRKFANVPFVELQKEIERRQRLLPKLIAERDALNCQIAGLQGLTQAMPEQPTKQRVTRRGHGRNKMSLGDTLAMFIKGKVKVRIAEAAEGVLAAGYETKSRNFRDIVKQTLRKDERFTRVGRGQFAMMR